VAPVRENVNRLTHTTGQCVKSIETPSDYLNFSNLTTKRNAPETLIAN